MTSRSLSTLALSATVFVSGAAMMTVELVASRLVARYLGSSLYTWTGVMGVILAGMALGNAIGGRLADRPGSLPRRLSWTFLACAAACLAILALNAWAGRSLWLMSLDWPLRILLHMAWVFLLPALALGAVSPMVAKLAVAARPADTGRALGNLYAWNAVGSIVGTLLTGFWLTAHLGSTRIVASTSALLALLALPYALLPPPEK